MSVAPAAGRLTEAPSEFTDEHVSASACPACLAAPSAEDLAMIHLRVGSGTSTIGTWLVPITAEEPLDRALPRLPAVSLRIDVRTHPWQHSSPTRA